MDFNNTTNYAQSTLLIALQYIKLINIIMAIHSLFPCRVHQHSSEEKKNAIENNK